MTLVDTTADDKQKVRALFSELKNSEEVSRQTGIPKTTVRRWCKDLTEAHRKVVDQQRKEHVDKITAIKKKAALEGRVDLDHYAREFGLARDTIRKAVAGLTFKESNEQAVPFIKVIKKSDEQQKARKLAKAGKSYKEIAKELHVAKSSVSLWCRDLPNKFRTPRPPAPLEHMKDEARRLYLTGITVAEVATETKVGSRRVARWCEDLIAARVAAGQRVRASKNNTGRLTNGAQKLTNENVVEMRRDVRRHGKKNWRHYAEKYGVSISVISMAMRGVSFKQVNYLEAPIEKDSAQHVRVPTRPWTKVRPVEEFVAEALALRRSDPATWTYGRLAEWMSEKTNRRYRGNHLAILLKNRDPRIKKLEEPKPVKAPRVLKPKYVPKRKPKPKVLTAEEIKAKQIRLREERLAREEEEAIQRLIDQEDQYEREMAELQASKQSSCLAA